MASSIPIKLVQITDTHLYGTSDGTLLRMNTADSLNHVVKMVAHYEEPIDLILATGDIAQDASVAAYENFLEAITPLNAPCRWIPGNHDAATVMEYVAKESDLGSKTIQLQNWYIVMLDTSIVGQVHGRLSESELEFLQDKLDYVNNTNSINHCMICLHHNPVLGTPEWMEDIGLQNNELFFKIATSCNKVKAVVYGHIHQSLDFEHLGIRCFCTPSTCIQFKPHAKSFTLDEVNPGYRSFSLHEDGSIESDVKRIMDSDLDVDLKSDGY